MMDVQEQQIASVETQIAEIEKWLKFPYAKQKLEKIRQTRDHLIDIVLDPLIDPTREVVLKTQIHVLGLWVNDPVKEMIRLTQQEQSLEQLKHVAGFDGLEPQDEVENE